jgi:hypothetical protein
MEIKETKMKKNIEAFLPSLDVVEVLDEVADEGKKFKVVNCKTLNVRETAFLLADILCVLKEGEEIVVKGFVEEWAHVFTSAGIEGYVMQAFIQEV